MRRLFATLLCLVASPVNALDLEQIIDGSLVTRDQSEASSVRLPREPWHPSVVVPQNDGALRRSVFRIPEPALTTLQLIQPLRTELAADGYAEIFSCSNEACGGFDFRFQLDLLPPPAMFVDLGNYRYLLTENPEGDPKVVSIVASSSAEFGFIHLTEIFEVAPIEQIQPKDVPSNTPATSDSLLTSLIEDGHVVLDDLEFATGSSQLSAGPYLSLRTLADWLASEQNARVVLVGHTDAVGSLEANLALSRRRAASVENRLIDSFGVSTAQVSSDGAGALSPVASNSSAEGRAENRRVEVVLIVR
ncbi:MAG: OmpA family protein [Pseudomonadota bacterium]